MQRDTLEPGVLVTFRLLVLAVIGLLALNAVEFYWKPLLDPHPLVHLAVMAAAMFVLLGWLSWRPAATARWHLPAAIAIFLTAPFASQVLELGHPFPEYTNLARERLLLLFPPLLIVGWQYRIRAVVVFGFTTAAIDLSLTATAYPPSLWVRSEYSGVILLRSLVLLACGALLVRLTAAQRAQREALRQANVRLTRFAATLEQLAVARERGRLAWELHDTATHALSGLAVQLEAARTLLRTEPARIGPLVDQAVAAARAGLAETRRAIQALRGSALEEQGLSNALRGMAESAAMRLGARVDVALPEAPLRLAPDTEAMLFRVAQEALENSARHSQARCLRLELRPTPEGVALRVQDDGVGFDAAALARRPAPGRFGLLGMSERAELLGAQLEIVSRRGQGTIVSLLTRNSQ